MLIYSKSEKERDRERKKEQRERERERERERGRERKRENVHKLICLRDGVNYSAFPFAQRFFSRNST